MAHLVFLLEEPSARDALEAWVPAWVGTAAICHFMVFQGKQDLEMRMVRRMRHWLLPNSMFIVIRDQDGGDCKALKAALQRRCKEAGRPDACVRIACRELESFFLGDWQAIAQAFNKPKLSQLATKAAFRDPDALVSPKDMLRQYVAAYQPATALAASHR